MKTTKLTTLAGMVSLGFCAIAATFDSIPFNTPTFSESDPLGVTAITQTQEKVDAVSNKVETVETTANAAKSKADTVEEAMSTATSTLNTTVADLANFKNSITNTIKAQLTNEATMVVGNAKGSPSGAGVEIGADSGTNYLVFAVNKDIDEMQAENGDILFASDKVRFPDVSAVWFGEQTLAAILSNAGQGEVNVINTVKVNGTALVPDGDRAVDITIPAAGDANVIEGITTNGVAVALNGKIANIVIPDPGEGNVIESITVNGGSALPINNKVVDITIPAGGDANVIESIKTNGVALAVADKAVDITIPAPGDPNVIEAITVNNGSPLAINDKTVDITIPAPGDVNVIETVKTNGVSLTIANKAVDIAVPPAITALYDIPGAEVAATNAIQRINDAQDIATIKQALVDFLGNFKKPVAP